MKKLFENTGNSPMYEGSVMIPPGESRLIEVPDEQPNAPEAPKEDPDAVLLALLAGSVSAVKEGLLPLTTEQLDRLTVLEGEGKARKGVLEALADERIRRADEKLVSDNLDADQTSGAGAEGAGGAAGTEAP